MAQPKPLVIETAVAAWRDAFRAIGAMPEVTGIAFVFVLATSLAGFAIFPNPYALVRSPWLPVISLVSGVVQAILLAPLAIAVHRFVILGETTARYPLEPGSSRYLRFVGFAILVKVLWQIPSTIQGFINPAFSSAFGIVAFVLSITIIIIVVRRAILFPAIAVDAPGATWSNAGLDTKGSSWRVVFIFALTALPVSVIGVLLYLPLLAPQEEPDTVNVLLFSGIGSVVGVAALCVFAAAASHIYRARADVMTRPSGAAA